MNLGQWLGLSSLLLSVYILWQIREMLLVIFAAVILATALNRVVKYCERYQIKRNFAVAMVLLGLILLITIFTLLVIPPFVDQFQKLIELLPTVWNQLYNNLRKLEEIEWVPELPNLEEVLRQIQPLSTDFFRNFLAIFSSTGGLLLQILFILVLTIMMLVDPRSYRETLLRLFPSFYRRRADEVLTLTESALANWLAGILVNSLFIATLSGIGLSVLGINLVLVHALLAGLMNFIPNIGPTASIIFPIMVAVIDEPIWKIIAIVIWYFIIQNIESYWLTPMVMAKQVSLLPAATLIAQIFFATAFGLFGLILALPLAVVAKTWLEEVLFKDILDHWHSPEEEILPDPQDAYYVEEVEPEVPNSEVNS